MTELTPEGVLKSGVLLERERVLEIIRKWRSYYPEDIFAPLKKSDVLPSRDRISAQMARHILDRLVEDITKG